MSKAPYDVLYHQMHGNAPPESIERGISQADVLSPSRGFMTGFDFTLQLQVGCPGGCLFCYVPAAARLTPAEVRGPQGAKWGFVLRHKERAVEKFARHLRQGKLADKTLYWSGVTDPYTSSPEVTRAVWQELNAAEASLRPRRIAVQTRYRADRDVERMASYHANTSPSDGGPAIVVSFSLGTDREDLIRTWERGTPSFAHRVEAITRLRQEGICVVATLSPFAMWNDLRGTLEQLKALAVSYITVLFFKVGTSSANTPRSFLTYLQQEYPELLDLEWQGERLAEIRAVFGTERVLVGQAGFTSLAAPHRIGLQGDSEERRSHERS